MWLCWWLKLSKQDIFLQKWEDLPEEHQNHQQIAEQPEDHHQEVDEPEDVVRSRRRRVELQPEGIDSVPEGILDGRSTVTGQGDVPTVVRKQRE